VTHYVFKDLKPNPAMLDEQFAYVDGYILALEDILKDIKELQTKEAAPDREPLLLEQRVARNGAYGSVRAAVNRSLQNARDTMAILKASRPAASREAYERRVDEAREGQDRTEGLDAAIDRIASDVGHADEGCGCPPGADLPCPEVRLDMALAVRAASPLIERAALLAAADRMEGRGYTSSSAIAWLRLLAEGKTV
jgi:hypothetical protein